MYIRKPLTPEQREHARAHERERYTDPEVKAKQRAYYSIPEVKARQAAYMSRYQKVPENMERAKQYRDQPHVKTATDSYVWERHTKIMKKVFDTYGWKCACCGEDNTAFLTLDHVNGGGCKERAEVGGTWGNYSLAIKVKDPTKYQILCYNCNSGRADRGIDGVCPHKLPKNWRFGSDGTDTEQVMKNG